MRCCVPSCTNSQRLKQLPQNRITFHSFPKQNPQRDAWLKALSIKEWETTSNTVVCSDHFTKEDLLTYKCGIRRIRAGAVPVMSQTTWAENDKPVVNRICKICLTLDAKMYNLQDTYNGDYKLGQMYEKITGISAGTNNSRLPQCVCWQCAARLANAAAFRAKALLSDGLLQDLVYKNYHITIRDIISAHRNHAYLKTGLTSMRLNYIETNPQIIQVKAEIVDTPETTLDFKEHSRKNDQNIINHQPDAIKMEVDLETTEKIPSDDVDDSIQFKIENDDGIHDNNDIGSDNLDNDDENNDDLKENPSVVKIEVDPVSEEFEEEAERMDVNRKEDILENSSTSTQDHKGPIIIRRVVVAKKVECQPDVGPRDSGSKTLRPTDPVDCEQCGVHLPNLHEYSVHFKTLHPGIHRSKFAYIKNPYMCEHCGKMFQNTTTLKNHEWVHTGKKRFQCDHCHKTFTVKANLVEHMHLHEATRRLFPCRVCGKSFTVATNRRRHMSVHTGLKPFKCNGCEKSFATSWDLRAHVDHVHLKKPRPKRVRRKPRKCDVIE